MERVTQVRAEVFQINSINETIKKKPTAPGIPKRSPIQVLTGPDVAWLPGANETGYVLRGMAVDKITNKILCSEGWTQMRHAELYNSWSGRVMKANQRFFVAQRIRMTICLTVWRH